MKKSKTIRILVSLFALVILTFIMAEYLPIRGEEKIYEDMIRLHVIAASDSDEDQKLKLKVRDAVLDVLSGISVSDKAEAESAIVAHKTDIKNAALAALEENGSDDIVEVFFDEEYYPVRYYEGFTLPAGKYTSLRVVIGEGEGHNWWCVLFPPLCRSAGEKEQKEDFVEAGFTSEQYRLINNNSGSKYKVRFKILEILSEVFGFDY
ncbi:MAG: stage II sporulation protein R [Clostridia bacterium]|nr:stage II sporulation protein R [Clostridia bacterium]